MGECTKKSHHEAKAVEQRWWTADDIIRFQSHASSNKSAIVDQIAQEVVSTVDNKLKQQGPTDE
jgi:hypothetical protein